MYNGMIKFINFERRKVVFKANNVICKLWPHDKSPGVFVEITSGAFIKLAILSPKALRIMQFSLAVLAGILTR